jgi:hypothetical protein
MRSVRTRRVIALIAVIAGIFATPVLPETAAATGGPPSGYFVLPAGYTGTFSAIGFNACDALTGGYQPAGGALLPQWSKPHGCFSQAASTLTIGPFPQSLSFRIYLRDDTCGVTYFSDGSPVDHVIVDGNGPYNLRFADGGTDCAEANTVRHTPPGLDFVVTYTDTPPPPPPPPPPPLEGGFVPVIPVRVLDTRLGAGRPLLAGGVAAIPMAGQHGVPSDATAVVLNVTAVSPAAPGYLTVFPCGTSPPTASNVNYRTDDDVPNLVVVKIGDGGSVCITTFSQSHLVVDLSGYHAPGGGGFVPIFPVRIKDTRTTTRVHADGVVSVPVVGVVTGPEANGAVFNITVTNPEAPGFVTAYACDHSRPLASNLNYVAGQTVANLAMLGLGKDGSLCLYSSAPTDVIVDITGYFMPNTGPGFKGITPTRILDTRPGVHLNATETRTVPLAGLPDGTVGVVANVTATNTAAPGYLTVFPCGQTPPNASNVNYTQEDTVPNLVALGVGDQKSICVYSFAPTDIIVDITGFY